MYGRLSYSHYFVYVRLIWVFYCIALSLNWIYIRPYYIFFTHYTLRRLEFLNDNFLIPHLTTCFSNLVEESFYFTLLTRFAIIFVHCFASQMLELSILSDFIKKFSKFSTTIFIKEIVTLKLSEKFLKFTLVFFLLLHFAQCFKTPTPQTVFSSLFRECKFSEYFRNKRLLGNIWIISGVTETKFAEIWK